MGKNPYKKFIRSPGYGDDNFLHEFEFREQSLARISYAVTSGKRLPEKPLYQIVTTTQKERIIAGKTRGSVYYLGRIAGEIEQRGKIIKQEIYYIGELLCEARNIIKADEDNVEISFREWVEKKCDFSYSTALNFCRVYLVCAGDIQDVRHIKLSVLYKVCSKKFPEELMYWFSVNWNFSHMS